MGDAILARGDEIARIESLDTGNTLGPVVLTIEGDGRELKKVVLDRKDAKTRAEEIAVNVKDVQKLRITVSSGDSGYGVEYPAASRYVTAVGGTHLTTASNSRGWTETAWNGAGSGCSANDAKPSWQKDSGCGAAEDFLHGAHSEATGSAS